MPKEINYSKTEQAEYIYLCLMAKKANDSVILLAIRKI